MRFWVLFKPYGESQYVFRSHLTWVQAANSNHLSVGLSSSISSVLKALEALFGSVSRVHQPVASLCCVGSDPCMYTSGVSPGIYHSSFPKDLPLHCLLGTSQLCLFIPLARKLSAVYFLWLLTSRSKRQEHRWKLKRGFLTLSGQRLLQWGRRLPSCRV